MYTYIHTYIHTHIHATINAYTHTYIHMYIHTYIRPYILGKHAYLCIHRHTRKCSSSTVDTALYIINVKSNLWFDTRITTKTSLHNGGTNTLTWRRCH